MKRAVRIATYCHEGRDLKEATDNKARLAILRRVADELLRHPEWHPLDAVLFPGGFLSQLPGKATVQFLKKLENLSPGLQLVIGVDKDGEQLALAFNKKGLSGKARKIFPVGEDVDGKSFAPITLHEEDFSDAQRVIQLPSGNKAILCVCYDMFGFGDGIRGKTGRLSKAVLVQDAAGRLYKGRGKARDVLKKSFNAHCEMLKAQKPDVAFAMIHRFAQPGRESFWQRHGIASASAALKGGLAIGAAHIGKNPQHLKSATLAAQDVPHKHLEARGHRQAHVKAASAAVVIEAGRERGLLRLFKP